MAKALWKRGRGKLGVLDPLLGSWRAEADSPMGRLRCTRSFAKVLGGSFVRLDARWEFGPGVSEEARKAAEGKGPYEETALIGAGEGGGLAFWSFASDGKRSEGKLVDATDLHAEAVAFEAQMPAGLARMAYWPEEGGFVWVVESKNAKGWKRFVEHHYRPA
jgi:hypothetical protein